MQGNIPANLPPDTAQPESVLCSTCDWMLPGNNPSAAKCTHETHLHGCFVEGCLEVLFVQLCVGGQAQRRQVLQDCCTQHHRCRTTVSANMLQY